MNCNDHAFLALAEDARQHLTRRTFLQGRAGGIGRAATAEEGD